MTAAGPKSKGSSSSMGSEDDVLDDVVVPPDLPLEAIAEEVQNSWHLKVAHFCRSYHTHLWTPRLFLGTEPPVMTPCGKYLLCSYLPAFGLQSVYKGSFVICPAVVLQSVCKCLIKLSYI